MNYKLSIWSRGIKLRWGGSAKRKKIPQTFWPPVNCLSMASIEWTDTGRSYSPDYQGLLSSLIMRHCVLHTFVPLTVQAIQCVIIKCRAYYVQIYFKLIKWAPSNSVFIVKKKITNNKKTWFGPPFFDLENLSILQYRCIRFTMEMNRCFWIYSLSLFKKVKP